MKIFNKWVLVEKGFVDSLNQMIKIQREEIALKDNALKSHSDLFMEIGTRDGLLEAENIKLKDKIKDLKTSNEKLGNSNGGLTSANSRLKEKNKELETRIKELEKELAKALDGKYYVKRIPATKAKKQEIKAVNRRLSSQTKKILKEKGEENG